MFLVDTNVWLERLLNQERSQEVALFLATVPSHQLAITDLTLHSLGIVLTRFRKYDVFRLLLRDLFLEGAVQLIRLGPGEMERILSAMECYHLDFDDAYQYVASEVYGLTLVSFDSDFDRTPRGKKTPKEVIQGGSP